MATGTLRSGRTLKEATLTGVDPLTEFAKEVAHQLPVKEIYNDAGSPAARQSGQLLADLVKTIQLALAPIQFLGAYQDRVRSFIDKSVRQVPEEKRIAPPPQILGPVLERIRYEPADTPIEEMFQNLLSSSMNEDAVAKAHPAFPLIISQLSADEARLLKQLIMRTFLFERLAVWDAKASAYAEHDRIIKNELKNDMPAGVLNAPQNLSIYVDHLENLGLTSFDNIVTETVGDWSNDADAGTRYVSEFKLTDFGEAFVDACMHRPAVK
jgi:hypothetical protein